MSTNDLADIHAETDASVRPAIPAAPGVWARVVRADGGVVSHPVLAWGDDGWALILNRDRGLVPADEYGDFIELDDRHDGEFVKQLVRADGWSLRFDGDDDDPGASVVGFAVCHDDKVRPVITGARGEIRVVMAYGDGDGHFDDGYTLTCGRR